MATTWEKTPENAQAAQSWLGKRGIYGFVGFALLMGVVYLVVTGTATGRYYITIDDLMTDSTKVGKSVRIAGAVDGSTIVFDQDGNTLTFEVVNIPEDRDEIEAQGGLANVLHNALEDESATRLTIVWPNGEKPDLLQHEAQAIVSGELGEDGVFYANEVLLKCPTRYSDEAPQQVAAE